MVRKKKIDNEIAINFADIGANGWFMLIYFKLRIYDEVIIKTKHLRWLLNRVIDLYTKEGIVLCKEVKRWTNDEDEICVQLRVIGAVRQ